MEQRLTRTEDHIIRLMMSGLQRKEIASELRSTLNTVSVHFRNIHNKTAVQNEIELYNWYCENVIHINIRKIIQVAFLLAILTPSIFSHNNSIQRARRAGATRSVRNQRRADLDNDYLFN